MMAHVQSIWTVIAFVIFVGIVIWAYSRKRKDYFDQAANSILEEDKLVDGDDVTGHKAQ